MRRPVPLAASLALAAALVVPVAPGPAGVAAGPVPRPQAIAPGGFTDAKIADVSSPTTVAALPEGRAAVLSKGGQVRLVVAGVLQPGAALDLTSVTCAESERGLLGFAADPAVQTNGLVYLYYTFRSPFGCVNRVSRFTMSSTTTIDRLSEVVLVDNISSANGNHNGGDLEVGNDGYLYIAVGDAGCNPRDCTKKAGANTAAQDLSLLNGKILRVSTVDGTAAPDNPFVDAPGAATCRTRGNSASTPGREIFAYGLRNPYRFAFDPNVGSTRFFVNDVGQGTREEVNVGIEGANYGWPIREGICAQGQSPLCPGGPADLTDPIADYGRDVGTFITGGAFVPDGVWPAEYDRGYLFADGGAGDVFFRPASSGDTYSSSFQPFASGASSITDMAFIAEPGGYALYYVQNSGQVRKITSDAPAQPPSGPLTYRARELGALRALDTRADGEAPVRAGTSRAVQLQPPSGAARAALVNITMATPNAGGYVTAWATRTARPSSSNINGATGDAVANASVVPIGPDGRAVFYTSTTTHLLVDVVGYFEDNPSAVAVGRFVATQPQRFVDSRRSAGAGNLYTESGTAPDTVVNAPLRGVSTVPAGGVGAVALILTATSEQLQGAGYVTVAPHGAAEGADSSVNVNGNGDVRPNLVIAPLGADGSIDLHLHNVQEVLVDVVGYFTDASAAAGTAGRFHLGDATRELDTRIGLGGGRMAAEEIRSLDPASAPGGSSAIVQNLVVTGNAAPGFVTSFPNDIDLPTVSNGNTSNVDQTRAALAVTRLSAAGGVSYYSNQDTDLIVDVFGWFE